MRALLRLGVLALLLGGGASHARPPVGDDPGDGGSAWANATYYIYGERIYNSCGGACGSSYVSYADGGGGGAGNASAASSRDNDLIRDCKGNSQCGRIHDALCSQYLDVWAHNKRWSAHWVQWMVDRWEQNGYHLNEAQQRSTLGEAHEYWCKDGGKSSGAKNYTYCGDCDGDSR